MSTTYNSLVRNTALRINAIAGSTPADLETNYIVSPLTTTQVESADFSFTPIKDAILLAEEKLVHAIGNSNSQLRNGITLQFTSGVANEGFLPTTISGSQIIGVLGNARNFSTGNPCTEKPLALIRRRFENPNSFYRVHVDYYNLSGGRVFHTCTDSSGVATGITFDACVYNRATQQTAIDTLTNTMLLPDVLEEALVCGAVSYLTRDDAFSVQARMYREYFESTLQMIRGGAGQVLPAPLVTT